MSELGLFPLGLVLLPTERVPLHVFEERYRELIGECLERDEEFGLVYAEEDGISDVGTRAAVVEVLERFPDGRLNVLVEGRRRFRLLELTRGRSFHTGRVEPLEDVPDPPDEAVVERALELFRTLREVAESTVEVPEADDPQLSFALAGRVELAVEAKLELLAEQSEAVRLRRVVELLEGALTVLQRRRLAAERASGNGRVQLG
ncbi:MAG TPA: LON peptidase substrate-binding domain-containing protein [Gaiellaceae bacterium]|nr:LON peptidase substrate-binding domain-containing protein [Gaiellaceae bacterium]